MKEIESVEAIEAIHLSSVTCLIMVGSLLQHD